MLGIVLDLRGRNVDGTVTHPYLLPPEGQAHS
jgi:hypothetical protein